MPLAPELADVRELLLDRGLPALPGEWALTFRAGGRRVPGRGAVAGVRSGEVSAAGVAVTDALLVVRPVPAPESALRLLALDVETTGLDRARDRVVAIGWVPVDGDRIDLAGARRFVVRGRDPGAAAEIHGLTHSDLAAGTPLPDVLRELRVALAGRALLAHHAAFDHGFLRVAFLEVGERMPRVPVVCTMVLQKRLLRRDRLERWPEGALRLWTARERYGLPAGRPHDALGDALACAELYLGQSAELADGHPLTVRDLAMPTGWRASVRRRVRRRWWRVRRRLRG